jgi:hypothetical protein
MNENIKIIFSIIAIIVVMGLVVLGLIKVVRFANQYGKEYHEKEKQELIQCFQKTNQDFDWCYDQVIIK